MSRTGVPASTLADGETVRVTGSLAEAAARDRHAGAHARLRPLLDALCGPCQPCTTILQPHPEVSSGE